MSPRQRDRGFTLLELLVALVVFSALAALVYGIVRMGTRSWEGGMARIDEAEAMRIGWTFVQRALSNSQPEPIGDPEATGVHFIGAPAAVEFVAELPAYLAGGGLQVLRLQVEPDADERYGRLVLRSAPLARHDDAAPRAAGAEGQAAVLAEGVTEFAVHYYGRLADDDGPAWHPEWPPQDSLPTLVRIDVAMADGRDWPVLVAHPRMAREGRGAAAQADEARAPVVGGQRRPPGGWGQLDRGGN